MDKRDEKAFKEMINTLCEVTGKSMFGASALKLYFSVLEQYPIEVVEMALGKCALDPDVGFGINPALILKHLGAGQAVPETVMTIQAKAKVKKCPLGIVAARYIQPRSYVDMSSFDRNQLAAEFLELLPQIELDVQRDGYDNHELKMMVKYGVNPTGAFRPGIAGPADAEATRAQYVAIKNESRDSEAAQNAYALTHSSVSEADIKAAKLRIAQEMATIQPKDKDQLNLEAAELEAYREDDLNKLVRG